MAFSMSSAVHTTRTDGNSSSLVLFTAMTTFDNAAKSPWRARRVSRIGSLAVSLDTELSLVSGASNASLSVISTRWAVPLETMILYPVSRLAAIKLTSPGMGGTG